MKTHQIAVFSIVISFLLSFCSVAEEMDDALDHNGLFSAH